MRDKYATRDLVVVVMVAFASLVGCQDRGDAEIVAVENNDLGVTHVEIQHRDQNGDRVLTVRGLDDSDREVAQVTLRTGMVLYTPEPELIAEGWSAGTELTATAGQDTYSSVTPDRDPHTAVLPDQRALASFVRLRPVAIAITGEAGISFPQPTDEVAFAAATCTASRFPKFISGGLSGSPSQCCEDGSSDWLKIGAGSNAGKLGVRTMGTACRTSGGATGCGDPGDPGGTCAYGPCGAMNGSGGTTNTTSAEVFHPTSQPTVCGRDNNGTAASGDIQVPEAYAAQTVYTGITATCPYTSCAENGTAGIHVTLIASCTVDGVGSLNASLTLNGNRVSCSANQTNSKTFWYPYNTQGSVTHSESPLTWGQGTPTWQYFTPGGNISVYTFTPTGDVTIQGTWYWSSF